jgi:mannitol-specific phosphotransferase system IIBC component
METIMKIPFLLALLAALITGVTSIANKATTNQTCIRMIIAMVIFYLIGVFVSSTLTNIVEEQNKQKLEAENKIKEEMLEKEKAEKLMQEGHLGTNLDLFTDSKIDDGFSPLDLSQAVRTKINE